MTKTPSYLKGLAEVRARAAGEVQRYERLMAELAARLEQAREELVAADRLIVKFDARLDPEKIPAITEQRRYGGWGQLRKNLLEVVEQAYPDEVSTSEVGLVLQARFGLEFPTAHRRKTWVTNTVRSALREFEAKGQLTRRTSHSPVTGAVCYWRSTSGDVLSLDRWRAQAPPADGATPGSDGDPE